MKNFPVLIQLNQISQSLSVIKCVLLKTRTRSDLIDVFLTKTKILILILKRKICKKILNINHNFVGIIKIKNHQYLQSFKGIDFFVLCSNLRLILDMLDANHFLSSTYRILKA